MEEKKQLSSLNNIVSYSWCNIFSTVAVARSNRTMRATSVYLSVLYIIINILCMAYIQ